MTETRVLAVQADSPASASSAELLPRHFVLRVINEDIVKADADCLVVNHYAGAQVTGAAADVDAKVNNAILRAAARGELDFPAGRIVFIPVRRAPMIADVVAVLSMGEYEIFTKPVLDVEGTDERIAKALQGFGRSIAIACCDAEQRDVATVAHGAGDNSQISPDVVAHHLITGYWQGLQESGKPGHSYTLTLVEKDASKCLQLVAGIQKANKTELDKILQMRRSGICGDPSAEDNPEARQGYAWIGDLDPAPSSKTDMPPRHLRLGALMLEHKLQKLLKLTVFGNGAADQAVKDNFQAALVDTIRERLRAFNALVPAQLREWEADEKKGTAKKATEAKKKRLLLDVEIKMRVRSIGGVLYNQIFNPETTIDIRNQLASAVAQQLLLRLDEETVSIPWELMADEQGEILCLSREMGRQMELPNMVRNYLVPRPNLDQELRILLVSNPTGDLKNVEKETQRVIELLHRHPTANVKVTHLSGDSATSLAVLSRVDESGYDVFHFAGHASFNAAQPSQSGLVMAGGDVLTAEAISRITSPPRLIFFNACESADTTFKVQAGQREEMSILGLMAGQTMADVNGQGTNGKGTNGKPTVSTPGAESEVVNRFFGHLPASMVGTLLRSGITNFIGTTWPVEDTAAAEFAVAFYTHLAEGKTVGAAMREARLHVIEAMGFGHLAWASYVLYGVPWSRVV